MKKPIALLLALSLVAGTAQAAIGTPTAPQQPQPVAEAPLQLADSGQCVHGCRNTPQGLVCDVPCDSGASASAGSGGSGIDWGEVPAWKKMTLVIVCIAIVAAGL